MDNQVFIQYIYLFLEIICNAFRKEVFFKRLYYKGTCVA